MASGTCTCPTRSTALASSTPSRAHARPSSRSEVSDPAGDAGFPYETPLPEIPAPGADITSVKLTFPDPNTLKVVMTVADPSAFAGAVNAGLGKELLIATRFATPLDVLWVG